MTAKTAAKRSALAAVVGLAVAAAPVTAGAETQLWDTDATSGRLGANLQLFAGYMDLRNLGEIRQFGELQPPGAEPRLADFPDEMGLGAAVGRLEWAAEFGDTVSLDLHNRLVWESTTLDPAFDEMVFQGLGATAGHERRVDTQTQLLEGDGLELTHDLDRAVLGMYLGVADLYLGRQAIRWGVSETFPVADRFAPLSPFELDTIQRRGVDAGRLITHLTQSLELELVVADRGPDEPLSMGGRAEYFGMNFDTYVGAGRFWERLSAMGGFSFLTADWKLFLEGEMLWNLDEEQFDDPRVTAGARQMAMDWQFGAEYHYNGFGVGFRDDYVEVIDEPELQRGETYFMGRHYLGVDAMYFIEPELGGGAGVIVNVFDPSVALFPTVRYELADQFSMGATAFVGLGEHPQVDLGGFTGGDEFGGVSFPSEFGAVSNLYFVDMTAMF